MQRVVGTVLGCFLAAGLLAAVSGDVAVVAVLLALAFAHLRGAAAQLRLGGAVPDPARGAHGELRARRRTRRGHRPDRRHADRWRHRRRSGDAPVAAQRARRLRPRARARAGARPRVRLGGARRPRCRPRGSPGGDGGGRPRGPLPAPRGRAASGAARNRGGVGGGGRQPAPVPRHRGARRPARGPRGGGVSGLDEIAAGLRDAIAAIADGHSAAPDPLERPLTGLRADVLALAERRTHELRANTALTPTAATLRRQALVLAQFDACGAALYRLRSAVRELSPSAA